MTTHRDDTLLLDLADRVHHRFYGKYRGIVTDNDDPSTLMRIKATVPAVLGTTSTGWCLPCVPYAGPSVGFFFLPPVGAGVWIEFEGGDVSYPIWTGCYWFQGQVPSDATPTVRGIVTDAPHKLLIDDGTPPSIKVTDADGSSVTLDDQGVTLARGPNQVVVGSSSVNVNNGALEVL